MKETMKLIDKKIADEQEKDPSMNAAKMAERMRIDASLFSKWRVENQGGVNKETLTSIALGYSEEPMERAQILAAYASDQIRGRPSWELVQIGVTGEQQKVQEGAATYSADEFSKISAVAREAAIDKKAIDALVKVIRGLDTNPDLRRVLISLSKLAG